MMIVRDAAAGDMDALGEVFFRAVHIGAAEAYCEAQRTAWAGAQPSGEAWAKRLEGLLTLVADAGEGPLGFMSVREGDGYLDLAFVQPEQRGQGIAAAIYAILENRMRAAKVARLHTQASHMAKPFFERQGWVTIRANHAQMGDQCLDNWIMEKTLDG
jgi:putative acetyltransferase